MNKKLNINYQNMLFIWAEYANTLGYKYQKSNHGMSWCEPSELETFKGITSRIYGDYKNNIIVGKTTAMLIPIKALAKSRDIFVLDFLEDNNTLKSIVYQVKNTSDIITDKLTIENTKEKNIQELDTYLEQITSIENKMIFVIGGHSVYKYFLNRFPLMCGYISILDVNKVEWAGDKPFAKCCIDELLYPPKLNHNMDRVYTVNEYFTTGLYVPTLFSLKYEYERIKEISTSSSELELSITDLNLYVESRHKFEIKFEINKFEKELYLSFAFDGYLEQLLKKNKKLKLETYKYVINQIEYTAYILHDNQIHLFLYAKVD